MEKWVLLTKEHVEEIIGLLGVEIETTFVDCQNNHLGYALEDVRPKMMLVLYLCKEFGIEEWSSKTFQECKTELGV